MAKRILAFVLWGYAAWYAFAYVAELTGGPTVVALLGGLAVGIVVAVDPRHVLWRSRRRTNADAEPTGALPAPTR